MASCSSHASCSSADGPCKADVGFRTGITITAQHTSALPLSTIKFGLDAYFKLGSSHCPAPCPLTQSASCDFWFGYTLIEAVVQQQVVSTWPHTDQVIMRLAATCQAWRAIGCWCSCKTQQLSSHVEMSTGEMRGGYPSGLLLHC